MSQIIATPRPEILVFNHLDPETNAMAMAMYSRAPNTITSHLEAISKNGPAKFMRTYYVEYGHISIGDCGTTNICIENGSILEAKAVQDNPLYNGQESSTRYLDMAAQAVANPLGTEEGRVIQENWMNFYMKALKELVPFLKEKYPKLPEEKEGIYE